MAKAKLTRQSIIFLVSAYDDTANTYSFADIANMIEDKFGIKVSQEAVRLSYHSNKNSSLSEAGEDNKEAGSKSENGTSATKDKKQYIPMSQRRAMKDNLTVDSGKREYKSIGDDMDDEEVLALFASQDQDQDQ